MYSNPGVERVLSTQLQVDAETARRGFQRMLAYLDTAVSGGVPVSPDPETDLAWHAFILRTREYTEYCKQRFGGYLHHEPDIEPTARGLADCIPRFDSAVESRSDR
jgi:hypothetical protein